jgi:FkbM family methyltransferase
MISSAGPQPTYSTYSLGRLRSGLLNLSQRMPATWLGRRLALLLRRLALCCRRAAPVDAVVEGFRLRVHLRDNVSERKFLFMPQFVDRVERQYLIEHLTPGGVFMDIGANAGIYTLTAARAAALHGGRVLAVEANPGMVARLDFNVRINGLENAVTIVPLALSDRAGTVRFTISDSNLGESALVSTGGHEIEVDCDTLEHVLALHRITALDGIKIDVEGAEDIILVPFFSTAPRPLFPRFVIIENPKGLWRSDLLGLMEEKGYRLHSRQRMNSIYTLD